MVPLTETFELSPRLSGWHRYDPAVKADLFSTLLVSSAGAYLVDPIPIDPVSFQSLLGPHSVEGILISNANHTRAAIEFSQRLNVPILAHAETRASLGEGEIHELDEDGRIASDLIALEIEGAAAGEIVLHLEADDGSLIVGDALINMGSLGFDLLPAKYCSDQKLMRRSLRKLLDYPFARMLFAHGTPIVSQARDRLIQLLAGTDIPSPGP